VVLLQNLLLNSINQICSRSSIEFKVIYTASAESDQPSPIYWTYKNVSTWIGSSRYSSVMLFPECHRESDMSLACAPRAPHFCPARHDPEFVDSGVMAKIDDAENMTTHLHNTRGPSTVFRAKELVSQTNYK
jgi:hypothetical protein